MLLHGPVRNLVRAALPQAVEALAVLPHLDGAVLRGRRVEIAVRREGHGPDRPVMALVDVLKTARPPSVSLDAASKREEKRHQDVPVSLPSSHEYTRTQVPGSSPTTNFLLWTSMPTLATP